MADGTAPVFKNVTYSPSRMYNIAFPILILVPLIFNIIILFTMPIERTILKVLPMVKIGQQGLGGLNVGLRNPIRPGQLSVNSRE
jgi:hypothetical protein